MTFAFRRAFNRASRSASVLNGRGTGDLVIQVEVETPTKLTAKQKELLEAFRETETGEECPKSTGFFDKLRSVFDDIV
jgi:molecular chaperone DnaJ